ncbi:hypothetical protein [Acetobacter sp. P5B1]|uniref:hypothetical protein n=1 Tax=Acetobacter sp. P5B1 TaxID=2762620 RepID=UPI001C055F96|nr:hypothetical protein [Acetobacter sp. P5B1]
MATIPRLKFVSVEYDKPIPIGLKDTFVIRGDNWNDFGNYVRFDLYWCDGRKGRTQIGKIKILQGSEKGKDWSVDRRTVLPNSFSDDIGSPFISLGQSEHYYSWMRDTFGDDAVKVLKALRDISVMPGLASRFDTSTVFRNALLRENIAHRARRFGDAWSQGFRPDEKPSFSYVCQLSDDEQSFKTDFDFRPTDMLPGRVVGLIGRNAVGKTRFLAKLSNDLAQNRRISAKALEESDDRFPDGRPLFNRVLAVSYSAFDRFRRPSSHPESSYVYCGIRDEGGGFSQVGLQRTFMANKARVREHGRVQDWVGHIAKILDDTSKLSKAELRAEITSDNESSVLFDRLSSG